MYITKVTDYDNMTNDYNNTLSLNNICTNSEIIIDIIIPSILLTIPCGLSFLCLLSLMIYTLIKHLFNNK